VVQASATKQVVATFNIGLRPVYYDNEIIESRYFCDLNILPAYRGGRVLLRILKFVSAELNDEVAKPTFTVVFNDNLKMQALIEKQRTKTLRGVPFYHKAADLVTLIFRHKLAVYGKQKYSNLSVRAATLADIPLKAAFKSSLPKPDYSPHYDYTALGDDPYFSALDVSNYYLIHSDDTLIGFIGTWDDSAFKQTIVEGYSSSYGLLRPMYNGLLNKWLDFPYLPPIGDQVRTIKIHDINLLDRDPTLLSEVLNRLRPILLNRREYAFLLTLDKRDPLLGSTFSKVRCIRKAGTAYRVSYSQDPGASQNDSYLVFDPSRI
jgi:hypothetical protein